MTKEAAAQNSIAKSRSETASKELWHTSSKPKVLALPASRSIGKVVPANAAAPKGRRLTRLRQSVHTFRIATKHFNIGQNMVTEGNWLCHLHVRKAWQDRITMLVQQDLTKPSRKLRYQVR